MTQTPPQGSSSNPFGQEPAPYQGAPPDQNARTMAMLCHLLGIFTNWLGPLIIWLLKKDSSPFVDDQGKEALNFQLTLLIGYVIGGLTSCFVVGLVIMPVVFVVGLVLGIMATMKANEGVAYRYPFAIRLIK